MKPSDMQAAYQKMGEALRAAGRPIVYSLCQYGEEHVETWGPAVGGNLWRTTGDISDNWRSMTGIGFDKQTGLEKYAAPGHWNDPDMLEIGNGGMTDAEYRTHMGLWSILAAPLLAGNDIRSMTAAMRDILENRDRSGQGGAAGLSRVEGRRQRGLGEGARGRRLGGRAVQSRRVGRHGGGELERFEARGQAQGSGLVGAPGSGSGTGSVFGGSSGAWGRAGAGESVGVARNHLRCCYFRTTGKYS